MQTKFKMYLYFLFYLSFHGLNNFAVVSLLFFFVYLVDSTNQFHIFGGSIILNHFLFDAKVFVLCDNYSRDKLFNMKKVFSYSNQSYFSVRNILTYIQSNFLTFPKPSFHVSQPCFRIVVIKYYHQ